MIKFNVKELMEKQNITRYRLQKLTNWNYKRINAYFFNRVVSINVNELETLCDIFGCERAYDCQRQFADVYEGQLEQRADSEREGCG